MSDGNSVSVDGVNVTLDEHGHLLDPADWSPEVARALAAQDGQNLTAPHWWLIEFVRDHHQRYDTPPLMRVAVVALREKLGDPAASSRDLYQLFPDHPIRQACRYGGLPRPDWCI